MGKRGKGERGDGAVCGGHRGEMEFDSSADGGMWMHACMHAWMTWCMQGRTRSESDSPKPIRDDSLKESSEVSFASFQKVHERICVDASCDGTYSSTRLNHLCYVPYTAVEAMDGWMDGWCWLCGVDGVVLYCRVCLNCIRRSMLYYYHPTTPPTNHDQCLDSVATRQ